jgi:hypothetical protein
MKEDIVMTKYDGSKYYRICCDTLDNYAEILKRLQRRKGVTSFVLIYYSVFLIILPLSTLYFPHYFNKTLVDFASLSISICILACSLTIQNVKYSERIISVIKSMNALKTIKREIYELDGYNLSKKISEYNAITDNTEPRADIDFYHNVINRCKKYNINRFTRTINTKKKVQESIVMTDEENDKIREGSKATIDHLCEINVYYLILKMFLEYLIYILIVILPIFVLILSMVLAKIKLA